MMLMLLLLFLFCVGTSGKDYNKTSRLRSPSILNRTAVATRRRLQLNDLATPVIFHAFSDGPLGPRERSRFGEQLDSLSNRPDFFIHLGDIHERQKDCDTAHFKLAKTELLEHSPVPVFVLPGDNDYYECSDQDAAWEGWRSNFLHLYRHWYHPFHVRHQDIRPENFAFDYKGVLFVSFHVIGASVQDWTKWDEKVQDDTAWLEDQLQTHGTRKHIGSIVLLAHAHPHERRYRQFYEAIIQIGSAIDKPILYLHGDKKVFEYARDFPSAQNVLRVSIERGGEVGATKVTVDPFGTSPFKFKRAATE